MRLPFRNRARYAGRALGKRRSVLAALWDPFTVRERFIYGSLFIAAIVVATTLIVRANTSDVGTLISVPAMQCSSELSWVNAEQAQGQPDVSFGEPRSKITAANSAQIIDGEGSLTCLGYSNTGDTRVANALNLSLRAYKQDPSQTQQQPNSSSDITSLNSSSTRPLKIEHRAKPIEPNSFGGVSSDLIGSFFGVQISKDQGKTWQLLHVFDRSILNYDKPSVSILLPEAYAEDLGELAVRIVNLGNDMSGTVVLVDSMSVTYKIGRERQLALRAVNPDGEISGQAIPVVIPSDKINFELESKDPNDGLLQGIASNVSAAINKNRTKTISTHATVSDITGKVISSDDNTAVWKDVSLNNTDKWNLPITMPVSTTPGRYKLELKVISPDGTEQKITKEFFWGVVAFNYNKTQYQTGEQAQFSITTLDEEGSTVCNSQIKLQILKNNSVVDTMSTQDGSITISDSCEEYGSQITPDYAAEYTFAAAGDYQLHLTTTTNGQIYETTDILKVSDDLPYSVERTGPTRLYPVVNYTMSINVKSQQAGVVNIRETVPDSFVVKPAPDAQPFSVSSRDNEKIITWNIYLKENQPVELRYIFDAPDVSPAFYTFGPAAIYDESNNILFQELRQWQLAGDAIGNMLLFFDGATVPTGWTCVSCTSGDTYYQTFLRGNTTAGGTGGSTTHTHTAVGSVSTTTTAATTEDKSGTTIDANDHLHSYTPVISSESNIPPYRQLKLIRYDTSGSPASIPAGAIALFDGTLPSGWSQYSAQDGYFIRPEGTVGSTDGSATHSHSITGTTGASSPVTQTAVRGGGTQALGASAGHTHTVSASTPSVNQEPPYVEAILAKLSSAQTPPANMIAMWDDTQPAGWSSVSGSGSAFNQKFVKAASTYGGTGGAASHGHADVVTTSSAASSSTSARAGTVGSDDNHTHTITISSFSSASNLPPYQDVIFAKKSAGSTFEQSAFRFYENQDSTDVGATLAAQDTAANFSSKGGVARLRATIHVGNNNLTTSGKYFKLQYSVKSGSCDTSFSGESYVDLSTSAGAIRYYNNTTPSDGAALTANTNDPVHGSDTLSRQSYEEANNFTNAQAAINVGEDGLWDFAIVDYSAPALTSYCLRIVESDGTPLDSYSVIPEIKTADTPASMIMFYDGASIPSGWTCISCTTGDDAYQRFVRGEATYGGTGGATSHTPTATVTIAATADAATGENRSGTNIDDNAHAHTLTPVISSASNFPAYRQLQLIRYDNGVPDSLPAGVIGMFTSSTMPTGWTRYSSQDGRYILGENTIGTTGGSNTHSHTITGTTGAGSGTTYGVRGGGTPATSAAAGHTHTISASTDTVNNEPPYRESVLGKANSSGTAIPSNVITMWDKTPPSGWNCVSCTSGDAFYQTFVKAASAYGATGGSLTHTHTDQTFNTSVPSATATGRSGTVSAGGSHTHLVTMSNYSADSNLPSYLNVIFASKGVNNAPDAPSNLDQIQVSTGSSISVGGWSETQVQFNVSASDSDNPDDLKVCVEAQPVGTAFTNTAISCGTASSYSGTAITISVTLTGLTDGVSYHWQASVEDAAGASSSWVSFGGNAESAADFSVDATAPAGTVYDGTTVGVDLDYNNGALDSLSANWSFTDANSGISGYEYSIGTVQGGTDVFGWTSANTSTSVTVNSLNLTTSQPYYFNIRATDNAGNQSVESSDGQFVAPTLSFTSAPSQVQFDGLSASNNYTSTKSTTLTTSTNAYNGYVVRAFLSGLLTSGGGDTIPLFDGGTYAAPDEWLPGDTGFGYTSNDTSIQGANIFNGSPCLGGGSPPCYSPFSLTAPGDIVADHTSTVSGTAVVDENFIITHRVTTDSVQNSGQYQTTVIFTITAIY